MKISILEIRFTLLHYDQHENILYMTDCKYTESHKKYTFQASHLSLNSVKQLL